MTKINSASSIAHTAVMAAITKSMADGRAAEFRKNPSTETRDAIVNQVSANLDRLMKTVGKKASKTGKTAKTVEKKATEKTETVTQRAKEKARIAKRISKIERLTKDIHPRILRKKGSTEDVGTFRKYVERSLSNAGLDVQNVVNSGTSTIVRGGHLFRVKFNAAGPVVSHLGVNA